MKMSGGVSDVRKYIVIYPVTVGTENYFFDTLEEVKQNIEEFITADSDEEKEKVHVYEIRREIDVKALLKGRAGRNIKVTVDDSLPEGVSEEEYRILEEHFALDEQPWLIMLETVGDKKGMLWAEEIYKPWEVIEIGLKVEELLEKGQAKWWNNEEEIKIFEPKSSSEIIKERNRIFKERNESHIKEAKEFLDKRRDKNGDDK